MPPGSIVAWPELSGTVFARTICRVLRIQRSGYYAWKKKPKSKRTLVDELLLAGIKRFVDDSQGVYASPRAHRNSSMTPSTMPDCPFLKPLSASIADISQEKAEDIRQSFERLNDCLRSAIIDPTRTIRGSLIVNHEDDTRSHFSYLRPMTLDEIEQEKKPLSATPPTPYPDGIPNGYNNPVERPVQPTWRQLAEVIDCILTYRKYGSNGLRLFERKYPRMRGKHLFASGPGGSKSHFIKLIAATPDKEEWHLARLPTMGLHRADFVAYYRAQRGPVERTIDSLMF